MSYVNLTESALLSACNVTNPGTCKTQLTVTVTTGISLGTADCSNYNVQNAWWFRNTPTICNRAYNGLFNDSDGITQPVVENIETVSVLPLSYIRSFSFPYASYLLFPFPSVMFSHLFYSLSFSLITPPGLQQ